MATATSVRVRVSALILSLFSISCLTQFSSIAANELSLVVGQSKLLHLTPSLLVEKSPGSKPGTKVLCERVSIHGLSRLENLGKFSHSVKVNVSYGISSSRPPIVEICFHRNASLGIGMCPQGQWEKLTKGSWARSMSPFDHKLLDVRIVGSSSEILEVSLDEEFFLYRIIFLALGNVLMTTAWALSKSLVFYYSGAMTVGIVLVVLMVLFQGMRLLPTGRKNSLAIFFYSCMVGLGSFLLGYVPRLLHSIFVEMGIGEDLYNPLVIFLLLFLILAGAWLGFWVVRKLILTEDGSIDIGVSNFVAWSIWIFGAVMILQSSVDPLLAAVNLICGILISFVSGKMNLQRFVCYLHKKDKSKHRRTQNPDSSPIEDSYSELTIQRPRYSAYVRPQSRPFTTTPCSNRTQPMTDSEPFYYSTFHSTPERRKFSKEEWEKFTRESTKNALEGLVSSPDFSKWAVTHADRITLIPRKDSVEQPRRWFFWFQA